MPNVKVRFGPLLIRCLISDCFFFCFNFWRIRCPPLLPITFSCNFHSLSPIDLLLRMRLMDGCPMQGSIQLHSIAARSTPTDDLQRMLRQDGQTFKITYAIHFPLIFPHQNEISHFSIFPPFFFAWDGWMRIDKTEYSQRMKLCEECVHHNYK